MNARYSERCASCNRPRGDASTGKRPPRYCWQEHGDACRSAELFFLREARGALEHARALISTPRGTAEHLLAELALVKAIARIDTQPLPPMLRVASSPHE